MYNKRLYGKREVTVFKKILHAAVEIAGFATLADSGYISKEDTEKVCEEIDALCERIKHYLKGGK